MKQWELDDGLGGGGIIRTANGVNIAQCQRTMVTGRYIERKSDSQERVLVGITNHFIHAALFQLLFHTQNNLTRVERREGDWVKKEKKKELGQPLE